MPDKDTSETSQENNYKAPEGTERELRLNLGKGKFLNYKAETSWTVLRENEKPVAEIFSVAYTVTGKGAKSRPLTFVFNGGPGAASAYLHLGALGPKRVKFSDTGETLPPPSELEDNLESWLTFTDLVFVDPVGTGFSRIIEKEAEKKKEGEKPDDKKRFFGLNKDLETFGEFMGRFLSKNHRWTAPIFIAGESYGGFRVAKLAKLLQDKLGIGLNGAILISPALEFSLLDSSDYDILPWVDRLPVMAQAASIHKSNTDSSKLPDLEKVREKAEAFATKELAYLLANGDALDEKESSQIIATLSRLTGIDKCMIERSGGRIRLEQFVRELLKDQKKVLGMYDASIVCDDPFPDRSSFEGADPTLLGNGRIYTSGINSWLRTNLGIDTDREYHLLSWEVNESWKIDFKRHALESQIGSTDDLRYGMSLNPHMKVRITHGYFDLITPYFASDRICRHLKLSESLQKNLSLKHYIGGHMFYSWEASRKAFFKDMKAFYKDALPGK